MSALHAINLVGQSRPNGIKYGARRRDLEEALAAIELAFEHIIKVANFDLSVLADYRDRLVTARDDLILD